MRIKFGDYPPEYSPKVHGPYDPACYYGKRDTPFGQVKLGEFGAWYGRRNKSMSSFVQLFSRGWWTFQHRFVHPKNSSYKYIMQIMLAGMFVHYYANFGKKLVHRHKKYH